MKDVLELLFEDYCCHAHFETNERVITEEHFKNLIKEFIEIGKKNQLEWD